MKDSKVKFIIDFRKQLNRNLINKYNSTNENYNNICINQIILNKHSKIKAQFEEMIFTSEYREFLKRYYDTSESTYRIRKLLMGKYFDVKFIPNYSKLEHTKYLANNVENKVKVLEEYDEYNKKRNQKFNSNNFFTDTICNSIDRSFNENDSSTEILNLINEIEKREKAKPEKVVIINDQSLEDIKSDIHLIDQKNVKITEENDTNFTDANIEKINLLMKKLSFNKQLKFSSNRLNQLKSKFSTNKNLRKFENLDINSDSNFEKYYENSKTTQNNKNKAITTYFTYNSKDLISRSRNKLAVENSQTYKSKYVTKDYTSYVNRIENLLENHNIYLKNENILNSPSEKKLLITERKIIRPVKLKIVDFDNHRANSNLRFVESKSTNKLFKFKSKNDISSLIKPESATHRLKPTSTMHLRNLSQSKDSSINKKEVNKFQFSNKFINQHIVIDSPSITTNKKIFSFE